METNNLILFSIYFLSIFQALFHCKLIKGKTTKMQIFTPVVYRQKNATIRKEVAIRILNSS